jgi:hypothetical protein
VPVGLIKGGQAGIGLGSITLENLTSPCLAGVISPRALDAGRPANQHPNRPNRLRRRGISLAIAQSITICDRCD